MISLAHLNFCVTMFKRNRLLLHSVVKVALVVVCAPSQFNSTVSVELSDVVEAALVPSLIPFFCPVVRLCLGIVLRERPFLVSVD